MILNLIPECPVLPGLVNVGDGAEERAEDDLGVVLEEVDLHGAVGEVHHHGARRPEPGLERGDTGELVLLPHLDTQDKILDLLMFIVQLVSHLHVGPRLEQVLPHVVLEVVEQLHLLLHGGGELVHGVVMLRNKYQEKSSR